MAKTATKTRTTKAQPKRAIVRKRRAPSKGKKAEVVELPVRKGSVVPQFHKAKAGREGIMRHDDLGAAIRDAFLGANGATKEAAARNAVDALLADNGHATGRWAGKNVGMLRMNVTNVLRGMRRNGNTVVVRGKKFQPE